MLCPKCRKRMKTEILYECTNKECNQADFTKSDLLLLTDLDLIPA